MSWNPNNPYQNNPYQNPKTSYQSPNYQQQGGGDVDSKTRPPGIGLLVCGIIGIVLGVIGLGWNSMRFLAVMNAGADAGAFNQEAQNAFGVIFVVQVILGIVGLIAQGFVAYGGSCLMNRRGYAMAMTGSIIGVIPLFCGGCCLINMPFAIWALVVLNDPQVQSSFR